MNKEQLAAMMKEKGFSDEQIREAFAAVTPNLGDVSDMVRAAVAEELPKQIDPIAKTMIAQQEALAQRFEAIQSGNTRGEQFDGGSVVEYDHATAAEFPHAQMNADGSGRTVGRFPKFRKCGKDVEEFFGKLRAAYAANAKFVAHSAFKPAHESGLEADMTVANPANAGLTMPPALEQAMIDAYVPATSWVNRLDVMRGASKEFWRRIRPRNLDLTQTVKTMTSITMTRIGEGGSPSKVENTPWGWEKDEAHTHAAYGIITRAMLKGNPSAVNDFTTELTRGISDHVAYQVMAGAGVASAEELGLVNQVSDKKKAQTVQRSVASHVRRADLIAILMKIHDYFSPGAFFMGRSQTFLDLGTELDSQLRPLYLDNQQSIANPLVPAQIFGVPLERNWQSPILGSVNDILYVSPQSTWVYFQNALSLRSSDAPEWLKGHLYIAAEIDWSTGIHTDLNDGNVRLIAAA
jgi:HK97 family phage major capsid protein